MITMEQALDLKVGDFVYEIRRDKTDRPRKWRITNIEISQYALTHLEIRVMQYIGDDWTGETGHINTWIHLDQICLTEAEALEVILTNEGITLKEDQDRAVRRWLIYGKPQVMFRI